MTQIERAFGGGKDTDLEPTAEVTMTETMTETTIRLRKRSRRRGKPSGKKVEASAGASVELTLGLPPSTNKLYNRRRGGGLALTELAKTFREGVKRVVVDNLHALHIPVDQETVYEIHLKVFFELLENPGWFKEKDGERQAKTRYKKLDVDNRVKFLQDCVVKSLGIPDDCQVFRNTQEKHEDPANPRAEVCISVTERDQFFRNKR